MLNYESFKQEMEKEGHNVHKNGLYITIEPNNNLNGTGKGFYSAWDLIDDKYYDELKFVKMDNFNTFIYSAKFRILKQF